MKIIIYTVAMIMFFTATLSCSDTKRTEFSEWIKVSELNTLIENENPLVIDIRTEHEFRSGHIPGSVNMPLDSLEKKLAGLDTEKPVLIYCNTVNRVRASLSIFRKQGFRKVYILNGGSTALRAYGYPLEK